MSDDLRVIQLTTIVNGKPILSSIHHKFLAGTVTLILGRSGSGKTTFLETLAGLREPSTGYIQIGEMPLWIGSSSRKKLHREALLRFGIGFQHPEQQLFAKTIQEEFAYTLRPYRLSTELRKKRILASPFHDNEQADIWLNQDPHTLSGGQKRRLTLALLESTEPDWLLLDEPTSGIDAAGVSQLSEKLRQRQTEGKGTIVITHDLESLLEGADAILLMSEGRAIWSGTPSELYESPRILETAGLTIPDRLNTQYLLRCAGFKLPNGWPDARSTAEAIANQLTIASYENVLGLESDSITSIKPTLNMESRIDDLVEQKIHKQEQNSLYLNQPLPVSIQKRDARLRYLDPRAVWLAYILISSGILMQSHWLGWCVSALVTMTVIRFANVPFRKWSKPAIGLLLFTLTATLISGFTFGTSDSSTVSTEAGGNVIQLTIGISFAIDPAGKTLFHFSRLVMIMLIGFVLLSGISHLRLKRALEQGLQGLRYLRVPVDQFAFMSALIIQFIPMLMNEWNKFARIAAARGKYPVRPGRIPIRGFHMTVIPFLLSILRLGELLSLILIIRGVGRAGTKPTQAYRLSFHKADGVLLLSALGILLALLVVHKLFY